MTTIRNFLCLILGSVVFFTTPAAPAQTPQGTAFTYQGDLDQNEAPVNAKVDMAFALFDASSGGNPVGSELDFSAAHGNPVDVQDGSFTVALDFGALAFSGAISDERYLQVSVNGNVLTPRTKIENAPYALQARTAELAYAVSNASIGTAQIIATQVQQRVSGNCAVGSSIRSIAQDGSVTCQAGANGTVTSVASGTGLTGGPITGVGTLGIANAGVGLAQIDTSLVQARVSDSCNSAQKVLAINADGTVVCATDAVGGTGTVTSVNSGTGLTGGPVTANGTLSIANGGVGLAQIDTSQVQARIAGTCDLGEYLRGINADGSPVCAPVPAAQRISIVKNSTLVGPYSAMAIGVDGLPVVASYDATNGDLEISQCGDPSCVAANFNRVTVSGFREGLNPAIAIGSDQLPIVSSIGTSDAFPYTVEVAHCENPGCTVMDNVFIGSATSARTRTSIAIGTDGLPVAASTETAPW